MRKLIPSLSGALFATIIGAIVFASAGRFDLPFVWALLALHAAAITIAALLLPEDLTRERFAPGREGRLRDYHRLLVMPLLITSWIITGLDLGRWHWTDTVPPTLQIIGLFLYLVGLTISIAAMASNPFFSSVIRIQADRGHRTIRNGPYRFIRHPGYAATILAMLGGGLALGSWIGIAPLLVVALLFIRRTRNEDRLLRAELSGYEEYAQRVRWRLLPGAW